MRSYEETERQNAQMELEEMMPEYKLEMMYPKTYYIIYLEVVHHCDMYDRECYGMNIPTQEELERMIDNITVKVEVEVENSIEMDGRETENRQLGFFGRGLLRDFVGALLLREFFDRRHRPHRPRRHFGY
jgi:hypothetical protein